MPFASSQSARIHYLVEGPDTDPVLLLMGLGGHTDDWGSAFCDELTSKHGLIRMDNRGIGQSTSAVSSWTLLDMANDVLAVLDALGLPRVHVLGISMGGMIAQLFALEHSDRVKSLVLVATSFGGRETVPPEPRALVTFAPAPDLSAAQLRRRGLQAVSALGWPDRNPALVEELIRARESSPTLPGVFKAQYDALASSDRSERVQSIATPTLVVHGRLDPLIPVQNGVMLASRIPGARLLILEDCGHLPHLERTRDLAQAVLDFIEAV